MEAIASLKDKARACLYIGAVGDALGASVEFMGIDGIREKYGPAGIQKPDKTYGVVGAVTDDTQMTLALADGLTRAYRRGAERGILADLAHYTVFSYMHWLKTQNISPALIDNTWEMDAELLDNLSKQGPRAPGNTCIGALSRMNPRESISADNQSKGCGTVMRVAPIGLIFAGHGKSLDNLNINDIYETGAQDAGITHGHQLAKHCSGFLAVVYARIVLGMSVLEAITQTQSEYPNEDLDALLKTATDLLADVPSPETVSKLGGGWVAEEATAIALHSVLVGEKRKWNTSQILSYAVNHSGDSDSTGSIAGNIVGAHLGTDAIPQEIISESSEVSSLKDLIFRLADGLIEPI